MFIYSRQTNSIYKSKHFSISASKFLLFKINLRIQLYENQLSPDSLYIFDHFLYKTTATSAQQTEAQSAATAAAKIGLINSLKNSGLNFILNKVISSNSVTDFSLSAEFLDLKFYASWKLGGWEAFDETSTATLASLTDLQTCSENALKSSFNKTFCEFLRLKSRPNHDQDRLGALDEHLSSLLNDCKNSLVDDALSQMTSSSLAKLYYLEEVRKFAAACLTRQFSNMDELKSALNEAVVYLGYEAANFSTGTSQSDNMSERFFAFDDLLGVRLQLSKLLLLNSKRGNFDNVLAAAFVNEHIRSLYENMIANAINYKMFQVSVTKLIKRNRKAMFIIIITNKLPTKKFKKYRKTGLIGLGLNTKLAI